MSTAESESLREAKARQRIYASIAAAIMVAALVIWRSNGITAAAFLVTAAFVLLGVTLSLEAEAEFYHRHRPDHGRGRVNWLGSSRAIALAVSRATGDSTTDTIRTTVRLSFVYSGLALLAAVAASAGPG